MFHFKRSTLWVIIYVTIPLIIILNALGPEPEGEAERVVTQWSLDEVSVSCELSQPPLLCVLPLADSAEIWVSAIVNRQSVSQIPIPSAIRLTAYQQGGRFVITTGMEPDAENVDELTTLLSRWLPRDANVQWVVSADGAWHSLLQRKLTDVSPQGDGRTLTVEPSQGLAYLTSPRIGDEDQLSFLIWIGILKQRLAGYSVQVTWDHRRVPSVVLFNTTLAADVFSPVSEGELTPVLQAYLNAADQRLRNQEQLHRYAVTAAVYDLPFDYFIQQPERLARIDLDAVNRMREFSLEQITQTAQ